MKSKKTPTKLIFKQWCEEKNDLPSENGIWAVLCRDKETKEEWFTFAEFILCRFPGCKVDYDEWRILGAIHGSSFARGSEDNWFDVIAWSKIELLYE